MSSDEKKEKNKQESLLADQWEISENSMLTDEIRLANQLYIEKNKIEPEPLSLGSLLNPTAPKTAPVSSLLDEETISQECKSAAETLIRSLTTALEKEPQNSQSLKKRVIQSTSDTLEPTDTDDFPTSANPFKHATDSGLIEIARSINTCEPTLLWLSESANNAIRMAVAINPAASKKVLARLVKDADGQVRLATLENPSLTSDLVVDLLKDSNPLVSLRACEVLNERRKANGLAPLPKKSGKITVSDLPALKAGAVNERIEPPITASGAYAVVAFLKMIARRYSTPSERLTELANHFDPEVRAAVAKNSNCPIDVLWGLVNDTEAIVKRNLIKNESVPEELIQELKKDPDKSVAGAAMAELKKFETGAE